jgi:hypothetical protein
MAQDHGGDGSIRATCFMASGLKDRTRKKTRGWRTAADRDLWNLFEVGNTPKIKSPLS